MSAGGAAGGLAVMGTVYLVAEALVVAALFSVLGLVVLGGIVIALLVYVARHPIRTLSGWIIFFAASTTVVGMPFAIMDLVVFQGRTTVDMDDVSWFGALVSLGCAFLLFWSLNWVAEIYEACRRIGRPPLSTHVR